jgi:hypothetical protein
LPLAVPHDRTGEAGVRMGGEMADELLDAVGCKLDVVLGQVDVLGRGFREAPVHASREPRVRGNRHQSNSGESFNDLADPLTRGTRVVNNENLAGRVGLLNHRSKRPRKQLRAVVAEHDDADGGHLYLTASSSNDRNQAGKIHAHRCSYGSGKRFAPDELVDERR